MKMVLFLWNLIICKLSTQKSCVQYYCIAIRFLIVYLKKEVYTYKYTLIVVTNSCVPIIVSYNVLCIHKKLIQC